MPKPKSIRQPTRHPDLFKDVEKLAEINKKSFNGFVIDLMIKAVEKNEKL